VPERLANKVAGSLKFLFTPIGASVAVALCMFIFAEYWLHIGLASLSLGVLFKSIHEASLLSVCGSIAAILIATLLHEFGHCSAVSAFGSRVRRIGLGIYWLSPALFSDVSAAWTLTRWKRVAVDCGGIYFQALVCSVYALATMLTTSAALQLAFRIAIVANIVAIVSSLNPIMKCDGYWMISDAMCIPNLRRQSERALRDFFRRVFRWRAQPSPGESESKRFLIFYGFTSLAFSAIMFVLFAMVIKRNAPEAIYFPKEVWNFFGRSVQSRNLGFDCSRIAIDFLKVVPIACAPIALVTAASGLMGFLSRTFTNSD